MFTSWGLAMVRGRTDLGALFEKNQRWMKEPQRGVKSDTYPAAEGKISKGLSPPQKTGHTHYRELERSIWDSSQGSYLYFYKTTSM